MNDRISDLLDELADDGGRPLGFSAADLATRGRAVRRRRTTIAAITGAAVAVAAAVAFAVVAPADRTSEPPPSAPRTTATDSATPTQDPTSEAPRLTAADQQVVERCVAQDPSFAGWVLDAQVSDADGTLASFVSATGDRWRTCAYGRTGRPTTSPMPLASGPFDPEAIRQQGGVEFTDLCPKDGPPSCSVRLYSSALPLPEGVASVEIETPQGRRVDAVVGRATYVYLFTEDGVADNVPPVVATLRDAAGATLLTYDYNGLMR